MRKRLHSLVLTALLLIFSLQMIAAELGEAGSQGVGLLWLLHQAIQEVSEHQDGKGLSASPHAAR